MNGRIKVAYDSQIFTWQKYGGISRYICEIASQLSRDSNFKIKVCSGLSQNQHLPNYSDILVDGIQIPYTPKTGKIIQPINDVLNRKSFNIDRPDIVHETYFNIRDNTQNLSKIVITVHDLIHEKFIDPIGNSRFTKIRATAIERADRIVCISENTRKDLLNIFNIDSSKISVIYHGYSLFDSAVKCDKPLVSKPYILYVGDRKPAYKNFHQLLNVYATRAKLRDYFTLVCFGVKAFSHSELNQIVRLNINPESILNYYGDDSILSNLYAHASALIYPSLYEGFGIPLLEAMSLECPVICSNTSSIPEVVGDAGKYFNPDEVDSIGDAIEEVIFSSFKSEDLKQRGKEQIKKFSWEKCARETASVYQQLV
jgi:glycosyltransferase involved in cell wall biosynthesis